MYYGCFVAIIIACLGHVSAKSFNLVQGDGTIRSSSQLSNYLGGEASVGDCRLVSVLDCSDSGCTVVNRMFGTALLAQKDSGVTMDVSKDLLVFYGNFQEMYSDKFCGSKATDFFGKISSTICVLLRGGEDLNDSLENYDQILRRIVFNAVRNGDDHISLVFAISDSSDLDGSKLILNSKIASIFSETIGAESVKNLDDILEVTVVTQSSNMEDIVAESKDIATLGSILAEKWISVNKGTTTAVLSSVERESLYVVEDAYCKGIAQLEMTINQFRSRVNSGKVIQNFGKRVEKMTSDISKAYYEATMGCNIVRERANRATLLSANIRRAANTIFKQQIGLIQSSSANKFKQTLVNGMRKGLSDEDQQQSLRQALYDFRLEAGELECGTFSELDAAAAVTEQSTTLQNILKEFPESNQARLETLKQMTKKVQKPRRKKGRAVNIGLNLVGMLRPPGYGNLQGFAGYSTGLLGLPLDILVGFQNDGDSPEVMGDDREYPVLRLQPKIHFDIDV